MNDKTVDRLKVSGKFNNNNFNKKKTAQVIALTRYILILHKMEFSFRRILLVFGIFASPLVSLFKNSENLCEKPVGTVEKIFLNI